MGKAIDLNYLRQSPAVDSGSSPKEFFCPTALNKQSLLESVLLEQGDLYFSRFADASFSQAVFNELRITTSGIAVTVAVRAAEFGELVEKASEGAIKSVEVRRAYYRRQVLPQLEEIYKYAPFLSAQTRTKKLRAELETLTALYKRSVTEKDFSLEEETLAGINKFHKMLIKLMPVPEFLARIKDILSLKNWLTEVDYLSAQEKEFVNGLEVFWPEKQVDSAMVQKKLNEAAAIMRFYDRRIDLVIEHLNSRLWRWQGSKIVEERDYLKLLRRSAGWFSILGLVDWLKENCHSAKGINVLDLDTFFSGCYMGFEKKSAKTAGDLNAKVTDMVFLAPLDAYGKNPHKHVILSEQDWPFEPRSFDVLTSVFNLHRLTPQELLQTFRRANYCLKPGGYFVITVPAHRFIAEKGIKTLQKLGFRLSIEEVASEALDNSAKAALGENAEALAEGILKRRFYLLVFQKQKDLNNEAIEKIGEEEIKQLIFAEVPADLPQRKTFADFKKRKKEINFKNGESIEDISPLRLVLKFWGGRLLKEKDMVSPDQIRQMLKELYFYQEILSEQLIAQEKEEDFDFLSAVLETGTYEGLIAAEDEELEMLENKIAGRIAALHEALKIICPFLQDADFSARLEKLNEFSRLNRDFLEAEEITVIDQAANIWGSALVKPAENIEQIAAQAAQLHSRIIELEYSPRQKVFSGKIQK